MPDRKPTAKEQLAIDRELARARSEARFEEMTQFYPPAHMAGRDSFVRRESEKMVKELKDRQLQVIPEADHGRLKR